MADVRNSMRHTALPPAPRCYLDTKSKYLNGALGHPSLGLPYGRLIEIAGPPSSGKTAAALDLIAMAQKDGAHCGWHDVENSFDDAWARKRGVDVDNLALLQPYVGTFPEKIKRDAMGKETIVLSKTARLITAEELCAEQEEATRRIYNADPQGKQFWVLDSVTALLVAEEGNAGITHQNMRTKMSLAAFLSRLLRRWVGTMQCYNATIVFINQLRISPDVYFGNPEQTTGGQALKFYCHSRARMQWVKGGRILQNGAQVGTKGVITNYKNKSGGVPGAQCGYRIIFKGESKYLDPTAVKEG